ncbi:hypothetical protein QCA50_001921 [Cerrena zonata]|uniref:Molybdopterin synthase catalytic subunit n=1 Tax=Cerrena zonata TaxID=2478898 RepID=A0AAW0GN14_9APHY
MDIGTSSWPSASVEAVEEISEGIAVLTYNPLNSDEIIRSVADDRAGATAVFIGTTRNSFKGRSILNLDDIIAQATCRSGKVVTRLDYQAYSKLAIKTMSNIIRETHAKFSRSTHQAPDLPVQSIIRCSVYHRLGTVPVGEPSIVIAVSSPHRKESFLACEFILEEVKLKAQIWKREFYEGEEDEDAEWKANVS